jgi:hypothetical protein
VGSDLLKVDVFYKQSAVSLCKSQSIFICSFVVIMNVI